MARSDQHPFTPDPHEPVVWPSGDPLGHIDLWATQPFPCEEGGGIEHTHIIEKGVQFGRWWVSQVNEEKARRLPSSQFGFRP